jgi:hypothetical protein
MINVTEMLPACSRSPVMRSALRCAARTHRRHTSNIVGVGTPLTSLSEDECMMRDAVYKYAHEVVRPHVREMDTNSTMREDVMRGLFDNGVRVLGDVHMGHCSSWVPKSRTSTADRKRASSW